MYIQHKVMKMNPLFPPISRPEEEKIMSSEKGQKPRLDPNEEAVTKILIEMPAIIPIQICIKNMKI